MNRVLAALVTMGAAIAAPIEIACAAEPGVDLGTDGRLVLIVARMTPSGPPPGFCDPCRSQCPPEPPPPPDADPPSELDTICVISSTYSWFVADVRQVVTGGPLPDRVHVQMCQHRDGTRLPDGGPTVWLINASPGGTYLITGDNGRDELHVSPWGEPYLLLSPWLGEGDELRGPFNLPCSVIEVREEIASADFPAAREPLDSLSPFAKEQIAKGYTSNLRVDASGISPRYGISMLRLRAHLATLGTLHDGDDRCYDEDWARYQGKPVPVDPED
jgi:hypothetical protein